MKKMKKTKEELLKKVIEIENVKSKEDAYKYMIAKYMYSLKPKKKTKKVQMLMTSVSDIEDYFIIELDNDYMLTLLVDFLKTINIHKINMYDYSSTIINYYE